MLGKASGFAVAEGVYRRAVSTCPGVRSVEAFRFSVNAARLASVSFSATPSRATRSPSPTSSRGHVTAGLTDTGWVPKTATEVLTELETDVRAEIGDDVDVSAESVFGPVLAVCATKLGQMWELVGAVYAARTPGGAAGEALAAAAGIFPRWSAARPRRAP